MNKCFSLYLDLLRAVAALTVVFYHYSNQVANGTWANSFPRIGQEAVIIFFVLSGYVITYAATQREKSAVEFACKRISRVYSVYLPSLLVAVLAFCLVDALGRTDVYHPGENLDKPSKLLLLNLSFLNFNSLFPRVVPPAGGPYWSLTYEVFYYVLFFLFTYFRHPIALALICVACIFFGAGPVLLFPIWLLGSMAYRVQLPKKPWLWVGAYLLSATAMVAAYQLDLRTELGSWARKLPYAFSPTYTRDFLYFYLVGFLIAVHLLSARHIFEGKSPLPALISHPIRFVAGVSFSIYLMHLPLMRVGEALVGDPFPYLLPAAVSAIIITTCWPIERSNRMIFRWIYPRAYSFQTWLKLKLRH